MVKRDTDEGIFTMTGMSGAADFTKLNPMLVRSAGEAATDAVKALDTDLHGT